MGRRTRKQVGSTVQQYTYDGDHLIEVRNGSGTLQRKFIYGTHLDEPIIMKSGSTRYYYTQDGLGSTSELTNASGNIIEKYRYDAYGKPTILSASNTVRTQSSYNNMILFTGREYDQETGLYYYRARYYDSGLGRFLETDPIGYADSMGLYVYVGNNPINRIDPLGLEEKVIGMRPGPNGEAVPIIYDTETGQTSSNFSNSYKDPITSTVDNVVQPVVEGMDALFNNPITDMADAIPPSETTGNPAVDNALNILQILQEIWNRLREEGGGRCQS